MTSLICNNLQLALYHSITAFVVTLNAHGEANFKEC
jgi:hypothetical protein